MKKNHETTSSSLMEDLSRRQADLFAAYRRRMTAAAVISSACFALMIGATVAFLTALLSWLLDYNGVWLAVGLGLGSAALAGCLLFFLKFRPTQADVVRRIDSMGLEERTVTMVELRGVNSSMANLQRADTTQKLHAVTKEQTKRAFPYFAIGTAASVLLGVLLLLAVGMTTVTGLAASGAIPSPGIVSPDKEQFITVSYLVDEGGEIEGEEEQILTAGEDATPVVAVAEDGWAFVRWSDGNKSTQRTDLNVKADLIVTAIFEELGDGEDIDSGDDALDKDDEGDYDQNAPNPDESNGAGASGDAGDGGEGDGDGATGEGTGTGSGGQEGEGNGNGQGSGAGGGWSDNNQIIDGNTDYRDVLEQYLDMAMDILESGGELPPDLIQFIEDYFGGL